MTAWPFRRVGNGITAACTLLLAAPIQSVAAASDASPAGAAAYAKVVEQARRTHTTFPRAGSTLPVETDDQAYAIQAAVVAERLRHDRVAGYKGGAMRLPATGAAAPIFGVLFRSGQVAPPVDVRLSRFRRLIVETEIGFEIGTRIAAPVADVGALKRHVRAIRPAIEMPDSAIEDRLKASNRELVAANIIAEAFSVGAPVKPNSVDPNAVVVRLYRDGVLVNEARGSENLGDQWAALLWIVNQVVARRGAIEPGAFIITGSLGNPLPAEPGTYQAEYQGLGRIALRVRP